MTLDELAKELGLDKSSVSLALRNSPKISAATRTRVHEAARRLGYRPNLAARQLRTRQAGVIGLVIPASFETLGSQAAVRTVQVLAERCAQEQLAFHILPGMAWAPAEDNQYPFLPDGVLVWGDVPAERAAELQRFQRPVVVLDPNHPSYLGATMPCLRIDNRGGAQAVTAHLCEVGAKRLLFVQVRRDHLGHDERRETAHATWCAGRPASTFTARFTDTLSDGDLAEFARRPGSAIFCSNDQGAVDLWHRLQRQKIAVPAQVRLAGFDGDDDRLRIGLTTAVFDAAALARTAFDTIVGLVRGAAPAEIAPIPCQLRCGDSTQPPRRGRSRAA
ncbi:MAG: hypothetical protein A3K19_09805 [Lentisphaerae bacterium RIFOXYB12_FULL_65_16]|nr:MAG: hypothetical protein A3K18_07700 [Lentisphaerae bacterium RIFOXYA12_64_32]OGV84101.1 MAG: hypothetical protein A3K19_09805 [Lentisphaerae bacterium RIFOXYB12_FULL_65_16]